MINTRPTPSPPIEDDIATPVPRYTTTASPTAKRRLSGSDSDTDEDGDSSTTSEVVYPPVPEDNSETRRIEENLRRWDDLDRERRRVSREAGQPRPQSSSSLMRTASRTASMLIGSKKWTRLPEGGRRRRDSLSLEDVALETLPSQACTSTPNRDPFADPSSSQHNSTIMSSTANTPLATPAAGTAGGLLSRPVLHASSSSSTAAAPGPPRPLDLPSPTTAPAHLWEDTPPPPVASPITGSSPESQHRSGVEHEKEARWWHEWLCGFGEGPDRGGEKQAGRTNPFE